jgi:hypothetical protein
MVIEVLTIPLSGKRQMRFALQRGWRRKNGAAWRSCFFSSQTYFYFNKIVVIPESLA